MRAEVIYAKSLLAGVFNENNVLAGIMIATTNSIYHKFIDKYLIADWEYIGYLFPLVFINFVLAWVIHWKKNPWSLPKGERLVIKTILYLLLVWALALTSNYTINGVHPTVLDWVDDVVFTSMMVRELASIAKKSTVLLPGFIPQSVIDKISKSSTAPEATTEQP